MIEITAEVIGNSSAQKAVGYDRISMAIIKDNKTTLAEVLSHMINTILRTRTRYSVHDQHILHFLLPSSYLWG